MGVNQVSHSGKQSYVYSNTSMRDRTHIKPNIRLRFVYYLDPKPAPTNWVLEGNIKVR